MDGDGDSRALALLAYRANSNMFHKDPPASFMKNPPGRTNLCVTVASNIVHQKVDQPALFLKDGKKIDDVGVGVAHG